MPPFLMGPVTSTSGPLAGLLVALGGLGVLVPGGLLFYYGDADVNEYQWKGPASAVVIVIVCVAAVVALQHPGLGRMRAVGYVVLVRVASFVAFLASARYYEERCDDPGFAGDCGLPVIAAMLYCVIAAVCVVALIIGAELLKRRTKSRGMTRVRVRGADAVCNVALVRSARCLPQIRAR